MPVRDLIAPLVPAALKRRHERWSVERFARAVQGPTREYLVRHGAVVRHGPFAGMDYLDDLDDATGYLVAKLTGAYEAELHAVVERWIAHDFEHVVDVGCADGYYAVGFARAMAGTTVSAFDIDATARERCAKLARRNGVAHRVHIGEACTTATLDAFPETGVALLADCEGYERTLLDPDAQPRLRGWPILVELHEFLDPEIADDIAARFEPSHEVQLIEGTQRDPAAIPELGFLDASAQAALVSERRPARMRWAALWPRQPRP